MSGISAVDDNQTDIISLQNNTDFDNALINRPDDTYSFKTLYEEIDNCEGNQLKLTNDYTYRSGDGKELGIIIQKEN